MKTPLTLLLGGCGEEDASVEVNVVFLLLHSRNKREEDSVPNITPNDSSVSICLLS